MDMMPEHEADVKCPACGAELKLEAAASDAPEDKKAPKLSHKAPPKKNAAKMPMDSLKSVIMGSPEPKPGMGAM